MIDRIYPLLVVRQCQLLGVARSTAYYQSTPVSEPVLALMRRIDALHLHYPLAGARMFSCGKRTTPIERRYVATLKRGMGIEVVYRKPRTSYRYAAHTIYPYLLTPSQRSPPVWG
jgi:putative transposase